MSGEWDEVYLDQIADCEKRESRLTDWERTFVDSIRSQIEQGRRPSPKQIEVLDRIWESATAGFGPGQLYRVQAGDGRGPWRPGLSKHWIDAQSDKPLHPDVVTAFGLDWRSKIPKGWHCGCACRDLVQLFSWFTTRELASLAGMGYRAVCFMPNKIIAEDAHQVIFARKKPLTIGVITLWWPDDVRALLTKEINEHQPLVWR